MDYQTSYVLWWMGMILGLILFGIATQVEGVASGVLIAVGAVVFLLGEIGKAIWFRCPKCRKHLGGKAASVPDFCPHCGTKLGFTDDEDE